MKKKLRSTSQFYPDLSALPVDSLMLHSQTGEQYQLAQLGSLDDVYDRLARYDIEDAPLNKDVALRAILYFLDKIKSCHFVPVQDAMDALDLTKSIGFGASNQKVFSRADPKMIEYLYDYLNSTKQNIHHVMINGSQKDEIRVSTKTPRLFTAFPPEHTFMCSIVLGDFMRQFLEHRFCVDGSISSVGDSVQNGAAAIYKQELSRLPYLYCTDTSAQDASVSPDFLNMVYDQIKLKYELDEEEDTFFEAVRFNSINKLMNVNGELFLVPRGLGSGDYLTIVINIMWRFYMILENYHYPLDSYLKDNTTVICGDDLVMASKYKDLDLNSRHAKIEWAGRPVDWEDMDFCSVSFSPYVHHDPKKVLAVLNHRKRRAHCLSPELELQRLAGLLRVLTNRSVYNQIHSQMIQLVKDHPICEQSYHNLWISYEDLYSNYNCPYSYDY